MNVVDENHVFFVDLPSVALKLNSVCFRLTPLSLPDPADDQDGKSGADDEAENAGDGCDVPESDLAVMEVARFRFVVIFVLLGLFRHSRYFRFRGHNSVFFLGRARR